VATAEHEVVERKDLKGLGWIYDQNDDYTQFRMINENLARETSWHDSAGEAADEACTIQQQINTGRASEPDEEIAATISPEESRLDAAARAFLLAPETEQVIITIRTAHQGGYSTRRFENDFWNLCDTAAQEQGFDKWTFIDKVETLFDVKSGDFKVEIVPTSPEVVEPAPEPVQESLLAQQDIETAAQANEQAAASFNELDIDPKKALHDPAAAVTIIGRAVAPPLQVQMLPSKITRHPSLLMRAGGLDEAHVADLRVRLEAGRTLPPVDVFFDEDLSVYWLADGNHRHEAARPGDMPLDINLHYGSLRDARRFAIGANTEHGLKRTDDSKRLQVVAALADSEWFRLSDTLVGEMAGVTQPFVSAVRAHLTKLIPLLQLDEDGEKSDEEFAEETAAPIGLVRVVRGLLPDERASLTQNILSDDGVRMGRDGRAIHTGQIGKTKEPEGEEQTLFTDENIATESGAVTEAEQQPEAEPATIRPSDPLSAEATEAIEDGLSETTEAEDVTKQAVGETTSTISETKPAETETQTHAQPAQPQTPTAEPKRDRWVEVEQKLNGRGLVISRTLIPKLGWQFTINVALADPADAMNGQISPARPHLTDAEIDLILKRLAADKGKAKVSAKLQGARKAAASTPAKGGAKKGTTDAKVERIIAALKEVKSESAFVKVMGQFRLGRWPKPDLSRFSDTHAQAIRKALSERAGKLKVKGAKK
jgi:hypothetical protein